MFTESNPGQKFQIKQIHNKAEAVEGRIYYGYDDNKVIRAYRGTHEGRLKDETELISAENNIVTAQNDILSNSETIANHEERIVTIETALPTKADKCLAIALAIVL